MIVISNTTPLIGLSLLGRFDLLKSLFNEITIPLAVYNELVVKGAGRIGANEIANGVNEGWVHIKDVPSTPILMALKVDLDEGESEAITLALEQHADLLLMDERRGRAKAKALELEVTGTIGVLLLAREKGIAIDLQSELVQLQKHGFRIRDSLIQQIIQQHQV